MDSADNDFAVGLDESWKGHVYARGVPECHEHCESCMDFGCPQPTHNPHWLTGYFRTTPCDSEYSDGFYTSWLCLRCFEHYRVPLELKIQKPTTAHSDEDLELVARVVDKIRGEAGFGLQRADPETRALVLMATADRVIADSGFEGLFGLPLEEGPYRWFAQAYAEVGSHLCAEYFREAMELALQPPVPFGERDAKRPLVKLSAEDREKLQALGERVRNCRGLNMSLMADYIRRREDLRRLA